MAGVGSSRSPGTGPDGRTKVLYIVGSGRSGTTVLNSVLGARCGVEAPGELCNLVSDGWLRGLYCSCGVRAPECRYWSAVRGRWADGAGVTALEDYSRLQQRYESISSMARTRLGRRLRTRSFQRYQGYTESLFAAVAVTASCEAVVDASKSPGRASALALLPGLDLRVIHLVRDPRGVAWSLKKAYDRDEKMGVQKEIRGRAVVRTAVYWLIVNKLSDRLVRTLGSGAAIRVRYEDLISRPGETLKRIGALSGLDFSETIEALERDTTFAMEHVIAGNRVRMQGRFRLRLDESWKTGLSGADLRALALLTGFLRRRYGYDS